MDQIFSKFLREGAEVLALTFRNIIDLSIKLSNFPEEWKTARLKPTFKNDVRTDLKNYRPILLLPLVLKIIEKSIHFQIGDYLHVSVRLQDEPFNRLLSGSVDRLCFNWNG